MSLRAAVPQASGSPPLEGGRSADGRVGVDLQPPMQRTRGEGRIEAQYLDGRTRLRTLFQDGAARIRLPHTHDASLQAALINTAGGLCDGDRLAWEAAAGPGARLVLTTPACERVYRALGEGAACLATRLSAAAGARIDWLPQETILFAGSRLERTLEVDLAADATFLAVEAVILGREAMGETALDARLEDRWRIRRDGRLLHAEATRLTGTALERDGIALLGGASALATILYVGADAERRLSAVGDLRHGRSGASVIGERLVIRAVASGGLGLRRIIAPVLEALSGAGALPRLWTL